MTRHLDLLNRKLMTVAARKIPRLLITMPPRHGKSSLASHYFPAWYLGTYHDRRVILASYEAEFAASWGRKARDVLEEYGPRYFGVKVRPDSSAANRWDIRGDTGGMITAGVGGPITGRGADLFIIDDPVKNAEEAASPTFRQRAWDWYVSTAYTRLEPGGSLVLIQTRWHPDDLAGRILDAAASGTGEPWEVLNLPALAEDGDPLGRRPGEALWPERYDAEALASIKATVRNYFFAALYQQHPIPPEGGGMFRREWFPIVNIAPAECRKVRYWDVASTEAKPGKASDPDWTAGALMGRDHRGVLYLIDLKRVRATPAGVEALVRQTAELDGVGTAIVMEQEPGSSGVQVIDHYRRRVLMGFVFSGDRVTGPKEERARPLSSQAEAGNVKLVRGPWIGAFLDEAEAFPLGSHDDQVDACSGALARLAAGRPFSAAVGGSRPVVDGYRAR